MRRVLIDWWCAVLLAILMSMARLCICEPILSDRAVQLLDDDEKFHGRKHFLISEVDSHLDDDLPQWVGKESFILTDYLPDGELERRISFNGITAKETSIGNNSSKTLSLWQVSDGARFIQLIYSSVGELIDCEYVRQKGLVSNFLHKFYKEIDMARARNFTSPYVAHARPSIISNHEFNRYIANNEIPEDYYAQPDEDQLEDAFGMRNLTYHRIEQYEDIPYDTRQWLNYNDLKIKCKERHRQMKKIVQSLNSKDEKTRRNATQHIERKKRDLLDFLMVPNTKWCGRGHQAANYNNLGGASRADKCCRKHDHCKVNIQAMTTKWQLFNYLPFTISHCSCDTRFRTCLKMADSSDASMVGKIFFNIVQTKCFVLKAEKVCKKRSWWGKCEKNVLRKRAHLRDNRKF